MFHNTYIFKLLRLSGHPPNLMPTIREMRGEPLLFYLCCGKSVGNDFLIVSDAKIMHCFYICKSFRKKVAKKHHFFLFWYLSLKTFAFLYLSFIASNSSSPGGQSFKNSSNALINSRARFSLSSFFS